jgi:hypothetical protein
MQVCRPHPVQATNLSHADFRFQQQTANVFGAIAKVDSQPAGPSGRSMGKWFQKVGGAAVGLLEWTTSPTEALLPLLHNIEDRVPTRGNREEEAQTLKILGVFSEGDRTAIIYNAPFQPPDLRDVLLNVPKPSGEDRRKLSLIVATQVRSLHVHFQLPHPGLRTESFVFGGPAASPDLARPYVLDWARPAPPDMYRHPEYRPESFRWFYPAWALMMVLSEIAEWRPLDQVAFKDEDDLRKRQMERVRLVARPEWKGARTAEIFKFAFGMLDQDVQALERSTRWDGKRFYDKLCVMLAPLPAPAPASRGFGRGDGDEVALLSW